MASSKMKNTERAAEWKAFCDLPRWAEGKGAAAEVGMNRVALSLLPAGTLLSQWLVFMTESADASS